MGVYELNASAAPTAVLTRFRQIPTPAVKNTQPTLVASCTHLFKRVKFGIATEFGKNHCHRRDS